MVLFSLSVTGMNQSVMVSNRQGRAQRSSSEIPGEVASEEAEPRRRRSKQTEEPKEERKCCSKCVCKPIDADTIDIYARAVFPFTFAVVNVIYWVAYTMWVGRQLVLANGRHPGLYIQATAGGLPLESWQTIAARTEAQKEWNVTTCEYVNEVIIGGGNESMKCQPASASLKTNREMYCINAKDGVVCRRLSRAQFIQQVT